MSSLQSLCEEIKKMPKFNQVEVLRILVNHNVTLNENRYGTHVNMTELNEDIINELITYVKYVTTQETDLNQFEQEKEKYKNTYFEKEV